LFYLPVARGAAAAKVPAAARAETTAKAAAGTSTPTATTAATAAPVTAMPDDGHVAACENPGVEQCRESRTGRQQQAGSDDESQQARATSDDQAPQALSNQAPQHGGGKHDAKKQEHGQVRPTGAVLLLRAASPAAAPGLRQAFAGDTRAYLLDGCIQPTGKVARAKAWLHGVIDDARGGNVGNGALQCLGHFDAHAPIVLGHEHQHAVATFLRPIFQALPTRLA